MSLFSLSDQDEELVNKVGESQSMMLPLEEPRIEELLPFQITSVDKTPRIDANNLTPVLENNVTLSSKGSQSNSWLTALLDEYSISNNTESVYEVNSNPRQYVARESISLPFERAIAVEMPTTRTGAVLPSDCDVSHIASIYPNITVDEIINSPPVELQVSASSLEQNSLDHNCRRPGSLSGNANSVHLADRDKVQIMNSALVVGSQSVQVVQNATQMNSKSK